jgi:hypothetical protein
MKHLRLLIVLAGTLLAVSACVVEPYGGGGRGVYFGGGGYNDHGDHGDRGDRDYGRRVWHE